MTEDEHSRPTKVNGVMMFIYIISAFITVAYIGRHVVTLAMENETPHAFLITFITFVFLWLLLKGMYKVLLGQEIDPSRNVKNQTDDI